MILRMFDPEEIAKQLVNVQPISEDVLKPMLDLTKPEDELKAEGYEPVSELKLMWVKK